MAGDEVQAATAALYRLPPEDFVAARDERVRALRAAGDRAAASEVSRLRRPTVVAWLVNLLVADEPGMADQMSELAGQLRAAQAQLAGDDLRALGRQRQELVSGLVNRARGLARDQGRSVSEQAMTEVEATLRAALADPDVALDVLSGRLVQPADYAGFGPAPVAAVPAPQKGDKKALRRARDAKTAADKELAAAQTAAAEAEAARTAAAERVGWLQGQLTQAQEELTEATTAAQQATERAGTAADAARDAQSAVADLE